MWLICHEDEPSAKDLLPNQIPWPLLQCIAIIQLYVEDKWIEPIPAVRHPFSLLYHQTMSTLAAMGELSPAALAQRVLTLPPFSHISQDDYKELLLHLVEIDHIQRIETGGLIIGLSGEKIVRNFRFYAVFPDNEEYTVKAESKEIGSIITPPPPGERFALAGRTWEVLETDLKRKTVFVKNVKGKAVISWHGSAGNVHTKILQRIRQVLFEDVDYSYLNSGAVARLHDARNLVRQAGLDKSNILTLGGDSVCIFPWMGTIACRTLERYLRTFSQDPLGINGIAGLPPYFLTLRLSKGSVNELAQEIKGIGSQHITGYDLVGVNEAPQMQKYCEFVPPRLLRKAFAMDFLDIEELKHLVTEW
jgi:ATP-dependent Lhr-like helicase